MYETALRLRVLQSFKRLHRVSQKVFSQDEHALKESRLKINSEFRNNRGESDQDLIMQHVTTAEQAADFLLKHIVQAELKTDNTYAVKVTKDTEMLDNKPFDPNADIPPPRKKKGSNPGQQR